MKIIWTGFAISELKNIYDYYKESVGISIARKIKNQLLTSTKQLLAFPNSGQKEENLLKIGEFRYLVDGNYKIIYKQIDKDIYITDVFDCRRDPETIKENATKE
jgi:plasmid stabilization system protein ParE